MNTIKRVKLHQLREKIVQDLDVKDIIDYLLSTGAVSNEEAQQICTEKVRTDQTRHLLDLLPEKGSDAFDLFVESLKKHYDWIYKQFTESISETDSVEEKTFYDAFLVGGVPHPPPYNVVRQKKLSEIQKHLKDLKRGNYVVLHGMTGSGKSCLAAAAVDNKHLLMQSFKGSVYWLTVGDSDEEELLSHMSQLLQRLELSSKFLHRNAIVVDKVLINKEKAKDELRRCFLEGTLREGLLILDDVTSDKLIDAFDIGCKTMVITKDLHVMNKVKGRYDLIKVNEGLTENESLLLLARSMDIPVYQLPRQAKVIHNFCQGSPMVMALIAGQLEDNKEDAKHSAGRWDHYVEMLSEKNYRDIRRNSFIEQKSLFQTISMSVSSLSFEKNNFYSDFALFMEDVNIMPEVLQTLWNLETRYEVEDIMAFFTKKSLAVSKWNEQFCRSVYGIHDLLLYYLKEKMTCETRKDLHRKLLTRYDMKCNGDYSKLPNDNYIYSYIGYHMYHADEWELFQKVFLDLEFIQSKLKITGPADMLADLKKYREQITYNNNDLSDKLNDFVRFIQVYGLDLYKDQDLDIVQCGLLEKKDSYVYKDAYNIAKTSTKKMYFEFLSNEDLISHPLTLPLREEIVSTCFTNDIDKILVADDRGLISLWGLDTLKLINTYRGHHFKVTHLELHPDKQRFLSCSDDGTLKLWCLDYFVIHDHVELNSAGNNLRVSSPQCIQRNWRSMFLDDSPKDESLKTYTKHKSAVLSAKFSHSGNEIVSCSKDCYIVWDCENSVPHFLLEVSGDNLATCCTFACNDSLLLLGGTNSKLSVYNSKTSDFVASFCNSSSIVAVLCIPSDSNKTVVISSEEIRIWLWDEPKIFPVQNVVSEMHNHSVTSFSMGKISYHSFGKKNNYKYVCASSSNDGLYLVTASSDYIISVWSLKNQTLLAEHKNYSGFARCLDTYIADSIPLLLCGSDDQTVKIWRLDQTSTVSSVNLLPHFDSVWIRRDEWLPVVATPDSKNRVQVLHGSQREAESPIEAEEIITCAVSNSGSEIFYGCADGQVKKLDVINASCEVIMKLDGKVNYLQFFQNADACLVAAGDMNSLKIWRQKSTVLVCYGQTSPVVQSFLIPSTSQLLACNEDAGVKLWDVDSGKLSQVIIGRPAKAQITSADVTEQRNILVLGDANSSFHVASLVLQPEFPFINVNSLITKQIDVPVQCCRISPNGVLLALGLHSGCVVIWNLTTLQQIKKLELHSSPVRSLLFGTYVALSDTSQHTTFLATVAEKIGWWNVTDLFPKSRSSENIQQLHANFEREGFWTVTTEEKRESHQRIVNKNSWSKQGQKNKFRLLGCMKLVGSHALTISSSPDFLYFLTVDTSGIVYYLQLLQ